MDGIESELRLVMRVKINFWNVFFNTNVRLDSEFKVWLLQPTFMLPVKLKTGAGDLQNVFQKAGEKAKKRIQVKKNASIGLVFIASFL